MNAKQTTPAGEASETAADSKEPELQDSEPDRVSAAADPETSKAGSGSTDAEVASNEYSGSTDEPENATDEFGWFFLIFPHTSIIQNEEAALNKFAKYWYFFKDLKLIVVNMVENDLPALSDALHSEYIVPEEAGMVDLAENGHSCVSGDFLNLAWGTNRPTMVQNGKTVCIACYAILDESPQVAEMAESAE